MNMNGRIHGIKYSIGLGIIKVFCRGYIRYLHATGANYSMADGNNIF